MNNSGGLRCINPQNKNSIRFKSFRVNIILGFVQTLRWTHNASPPREKLVYYLFSFNYLVGSVLTTVNHFEWPPCTNAFM